MLVQHFATHSDHFQKCVFPVLKSWHLLEALHKLSWAIKRDWFFSGVLNTPKLAEQCVILWTAPHWTPFSIPTLTHSSMWDLFFCWRDGIYKVLLWNRSSICDADVEDLADENFFQGIAGVFQNVQIWQIFKSEKKKNSFNKKWPKDCKWMQSYLTLFGWVVWSK